MIRRVWPIVLAFLATAALAVGCSETSGFAGGKLTFDQLTRSNVAMQGIRTAPGASAANLDAAMTAYAVGWGKMMPVRSGFDAQVAVAALSSGDSVGAFCADQSLPFDPGQPASLYCRTAHRGPDPLPQSGVALVAYQPFIAALPRDQAQARSDAATLVALLYSEHVRVQLNEDVAQLPKWDVVRQRWQNYCLAGLSLSRFVPPAAGLANDSRWAAALRFATRFLPAALQLNGTTGLVALRHGYNARRLNACLV